MSQKENIPGDKYQPEVYWDKVANELSRRPSNEIIAGDDEPYYRYKRSLFLKLLDELNFKNKSVLEVGSGPGGNLEYLSGSGCRELTGVDISASMIELSKKRLPPFVQVFKTNGTALPFPNNKFDVVFTSTVLQHNTNDVELKSLIKDICRVSNDGVILFERIEKRIKGNESNTGRPVSYYSGLLADEKFHLVEKKFLPIQASYFVCGAIRKTFNKRSRKEGEPLSRFSILLEKIFLPVTKVMDRLIPSNRDLAMLHFKKLS